MPTPATFTFQDPRVGDMAWITHRHAVLYATESDGAVVASATVVPRMLRLPNCAWSMWNQKCAAWALGRALVNEANAHARQTGYRRMTLWTNSVLIAARLIYEISGFELIKAEPHHSYCHDLIGEYWALDL